MTLIGHSPFKSLFFFNKKYFITIETRPTQIIIAYFLLKTFFNGFLKIIGAQNHLPIAVYSYFMRNI